MRIKADPLTPPTSLPHSVTEITPLTDLEPWVWFIPQEVWEIRGADFTLSPVYPAAQSLLGERGVSLRFPRFIKVREDKGIEQATSSEQLAGMYEKQSEGGGGKTRGEEE